MMTLGLRMHQDLVVLLFIVIILFQVLNMLRDLPWMKRAFITRVMQPPNHNKLSSHHIEAFARRLETM